MSMDCELCSAEMALFGDDNAFVRYDNNSLSKGHVLIVPRRHVADFFEMTWAEKTSIIALLDRAKADILRS
jgi:diadenosine tetraphosphate (Ap4A) HIT family hydrolase